MHTAAPENPLINHSNASPAMLMSISLSEVDPLSSLAYVGKKAQLSKESKAIVSSADHEINSKEDHPKDVLPEEPQHSKYNKAIASDAKYLMDSGDSHAGNVLSKEFDYADINPAQLNNTS